MMLWPMLLPSVQREAADHTRHFIAKQFRFASSNARRFANPDQVIGLTEAKLKKECRGLSVAAFFQG